MKDGYGREINYLRISLTENCNLKCVYCLPENFSCSEKNFLSKENVFDIAEIGKNIGIKKIRLTGGEPLLRKGIVDIVRGIKEKGIEEIHITTNGILLSEKIKELKDAGLSGVNISLDTLDGEIFKKITRGGDVKKVLSGIKKSLKAGIKIKINSVIIKGVNEKSISSLAELTKKYDVDVRFIELMPVGQGKKFQGIKNSDIYNSLEKLFQFNPEFKEIKGVAEYYKLKNSIGKIGFISPINSCFCENCNKIRITSDGTVKRCLNQNGHINIKNLLDDGKDKKEIEDILKTEIFRKPEKHLFNKENDDEEMKNMNEIGG